METHMPTVQLSTPQVIEILDETSVLFEGFNFTTEQSRKNALLAYWLAQKVDSREHGGPTPTLPVLILGPVFTGKTELARRLSGTDLLRVPRSEHELRRTLDEATVQQARFLILDDACAGLLDEQLLRDFCNATEWEVTSVGLPKKRYSRVSFVIVTGQQASARDAIMQGPVLLIELGSRQP